MTTKLSVFSLLLSLMPFAFTSLFNHSATTNINIEKLNGQWELSCYEYFSSPGELKCAKINDFTIIKIDTNTGTGVENNVKGYGAETKFKTFEQNGKMMITFYHQPGNQETTGEIVTLNDREFKVKYAAKKFYATRKRKN